MQSGVSAIIIIIILEDSINAEQKSDGRTNILEFSRDLGEKIFIRINDSQSQFHADDRDFLRDVSLKKSPWYHNTKGREQKTWSC